MPDLTQIVRPFAVQDVRPLPVPTQPAPSAPAEAVLQWGKSGDSIFTQQGLHYGGKIVEDKKNETKRTYDVVRVSQEDDEDSYVDTEVMTEYQAANSIDPSRTQIDPSRFVLRFAKTQTSPTVKIIKSGLTRTTSSGS